MTDYTTSSDSYEEENPNEKYGIKDVWKSNLEEEMDVISNMAGTYEYVAMDTEFPGVVVKIIGEFGSSTRHKYQLLRCNVDLLKIIQLGLTFFDKNGDPPPNGYSTWQFNFKFDLNEDIFAQDSINLLKKSGIRFKKHQEDGIEPSDFAERIMCSGVVLDEGIKWLSFQSGYDFGYLLRILTTQKLPADDLEFFNLLKLYFHNIYDIKYLMNSCKDLRGGLQDVAEHLEVERIGHHHQAGSDSLLTGVSFFKIRERYFEDKIDSGKYNLHLFSLEATVRSGQS